MKTARYSTRWGAQRYADELARKHPDRHFAVVPHPYDPFHYYAVATVNEVTGSYAYAGRRPAHFEEYTTAQSALAYGRRR